MFNVPLLLLPGVQLQIILTKSKNDFYVLSSKRHKGIVFKFVEVTLYVRHVKSSPTIWLTLNALEKVNARYNLSRAALKTFSFWTGSKSASIDNAVLRTLPKRVFF
jgi:hypothetical protein